MALTDAETEFLQVINREREAIGAAPLQLSETLTEAATWLTDDMATNNYLSHTDSLGRNPFERMDTFGYDFPTRRAENIAAGISDAEGVYQQWYDMCDPDTTGKCTYAHRVNMLHPDHKVIGIAQSYDPNSRYRYYWATDFGGLVDEVIPEDEVTEPLAPVTTVPRVPQPIPILTTVPKPTPTPVPTTVPQPTPVVMRVPQPTPVVMRIPQPMVTPRVQPTPTPVPTRIPQPTVIPQVPQPIPPTPVLQPTVTPRVQPTRVSARPSRPMRPSRPRRQLRRLPSGFYVPKMVKIPEQLRSPQEFPDEPRYQLPEEVQVFQYTPKPGVVRLSQADKKTVCGWTWVIFILIVIVVILLILSN